MIIIGLFDFLNSIKRATADPAWLGMSTEGYVFAALVYWMFCFGMSAIPCAWSASWTPATSVRSEI